MDVKQFPYNHTQVRWFAIGKLVSPKCDTERKLGFCLNSLGLIIVIWVIIGVIMPPKKSSRSRGSSSRSRASQPSATSSVYTGPLRRSPRAEPSMTTVTIVIVQSSISTSAGGTLSNYLTTSNVTTATDWASFASAYYEYRVLGMRVEYVPRSPGATSSFCNGFIGSVHSTSAGVPVAASEVANLDDAKFRSFAYPWSHEWRMNGIDESGFLSTGSGSTFGGIVYYAPNGPATAIQGDIVVYYRVQFRSQA